MITIDGKQYRNLQEQVLQNQQDIQYLLHEGGVLNEFGIKVVGQVNTVAGLPDPTTYEGEYGDAYAVGTTTPYTFYIWTRQISGQTGSFWFNVGQFPAPSTVPGPPGETGAVGPVGPRGSLWSSQSGAPSAPGNDGDQALDTNTGDVYQYVAATNSWQRTGNISGPQGPQGPAGPIGNTGPQGTEGPPGPVGPAGQFIEIVGVLQNTDQLPMIDSVPRSNAYAIPNAAGVEHVWYIIGDGTTENPYTWHDGGVVGGGGTQVTLNGTPQETIDLGQVPKMTSNFRITPSADSEIHVNAANIELIAANVSYTDLENNNKTANYISAIVLPLAQSDEIEFVESYVNGTPAAKPILTTSYKQQLEQQIETAGVKWVTITATSTATSGTLTTDQLTTLQTANMSGIIFNNRYYLRSGNSVLGSVVTQIMYTSVVDRNRQTINVFTATRAWNLTVNTQKYLHVIELTFHTQDSNFNFPLHIIHGKSTELSLADIFQWIEESNYVATGYVGTAGTPSYPAWLYAKSNAEGIITYVNNYYTEVLEYILNTHNYFSAYTISINPL